MNALDLLIIAALVAAAVGGARLGFAVRVGSWIGLVVGLVAGVSLLPLVLRPTEGGGRPLTVLVASVVVVGGAALGQAAGYTLSRRLVPRPTHRSTAIADEGLGALAGAIGLAAVIWLLLPLVAAVPGWPADQVTSSRLARYDAQHLPTAPDASRIAEALLGPNGFPQVLDDLAPPGTVVPPRASGLSLATSRRIARSVVKIQGISCQRILDGTGFVVADDLVATNAHVVAGESGTSVIRDDGVVLRSTVVAFDPRRDLALLAVDGLARPALALGNPAVGQRGGVFGHPGGDPLRIAPFEVTGRIAATGPDIYGAGSTTRRVLLLAASLAPGDSGSPIVAVGGRVVGVAFATSTDRAGLAYGLASSELESVLAGPHRTRVSTGACAA